MDNINIITSQNVGVNYKLAGVGPRLLAVILDTLFRYGYIILVFYIMFATVFKNWNENIAMGRETFNQVMVGVFILFSLPFALYHLLCETFLNGQSFGKKIVKLKVVKLNGTQPNFGSYIIRSMFRIIDDSIVGLIAIAVSANMQRLGDMVAGTTVIEVGQKVKLKDTILSEVKAEYKIVYQQVALVSDSDIAVIKEVLDFSISQKKPEHLAVLSKKIKSKYGISEETKNSEEFLRTLLADYSHYQFEKY